MERYVILSLVSQIYRLTAMQLTGMYWKVYVLSKFIPNIPDTYAPKPIQQPSTAMAVFATRSSLRDVSSRSITYQGNKYRSECLEQCINIESPPIQYIATYEIFCILYLCTQVLELGAQGVVVHHVGLQQLLHLFVRGQYLVRKGSPAYVII